MSSNRASLLAGLRTGGVRTPSNSHQIPQTAAPGGSFPRYNGGYGYEDEDEADQISDLMANQMHLGRSVNGPMTAGIMGANAFHQQQQAQMMMMHAQAQAQATQYAMQGHNNGVSVDQMMQMQMDMMRLQAMQQQQMMLAQVQMKQQQQQQPTHAPPRRRGTEPFTAGPLQTTFDFNAPQHRARTDSIDEVPMTAALGGKFGGRSFSTGLNPTVNSFMPRNSVSAESGNTAVISGGTSLGQSNGLSASQTSNGPLKSDSAVSWRRGSMPVPIGNPGLRRNTPSPPRRTPSLVVSPPPSEGSPRSSSPDDFGSDSAASVPKARPIPLHFSIMKTATAHASGDLTEATQVLTFNAELDDSASTPTPTSSSSSHSSKEREEASKKLYEGLGIGRPAPAPGAAPIPTIVVRQPSQPVRQPRGPPSGVDELGPRNFASRIRRKAIGGLENLVDARERRQSTLIVEAF